jgi:GntR family transcriptional regulator/MocR family aminotransferase
MEQNAGLHFLLQVDTPRSGPELAEFCARAGIRVKALADYYEGNVPSWARSCLVINYSGLDEERLPAALDRLQEIVTQS